ncbi:MAG: RNA polymerase sporulation sigma factor SigK [Clostridiales bacterium]|nr:RNA polymerase sporulation sigma factor SigK [Clostridiales bacterium]
MILEGFFTLLSNLLLFTSRIETGNSFPYPLSAEKEKEYLEKFQKDGDMEARNILVKHNLRLVVFIAKKYVNYPDSGDLISIGAMGLIKAINSYNPSKGSQLATYASRCIENEILMAMRVQKRHSQEVSLYDPVGKDKDGNEMMLMDLLCVEEDSVYKKIDEEFLRKALKKVMSKCLTEREKRIVTLRFGLENGMPFTQQKVADMLQISRSYISRIEKKSLLKMKEYIVKENLQFF